MRVFFATLLLGLIMAFSGFMYQALFCVKCITPTPTEDMVVTAQVFTATPESTATEEATKTLPVTWTPKASVTKGGPTVTPTDTPPVPRTKRPTTEWDDDDDVALPVTGYGPSDTDTFSLCLSMVAKVLSLVAILFLVLIRRKQ